MRFIFKINCGLRTHIETPLATVNVCLAKLLTFNECMYMWCDNKSFCWLILTSLVRLSNLTVEGITWRFLFLMWIEYLKTRIWASIRNHIDYNWTLTLVCFFLCGTKLLPELVLTYQWGLLAFIWEHYHEKICRCHSAGSEWKKKTKICIFKLIYSDLSELTHYRIATEHMQNNSMSTCCEIALSEWCHRTSLISTHWFR